MLSCEDSATPGTDPGSSRDSGGSTYRRQRRRRADGRPAKIGRVIGVSGRSAGSAPVQPRGTPVGRSSVDAHNTPPHRAPPSDAALSEVK